MTHRHIAQAAVLQHFRVADAHRCARGLIKGQPDPTGDVLAEVIQPRLLPDLPALHRLDLAQTPHRWQVHRNQLGRQRSEHLHRLPTFAHGGALPFIMLEPVIHPLAQIRVGLLQAALLEPPRIAALEKFRPPVVVFGAQERLQARTPIRTHPPEAADLMIPARVEQDGQGVVARLQQGRDIMDVIHGVVFVIRLRRSQYRVGYGVPVDDSIAVTQGGQIKPRAGQTGAHRHGGFEPGRGQLPSRKNRRLAVGRFAVSSDLRGRAVRRGGGVGTVPGTGQTIEAELFRSRRRIAAKVFSIESNRTAHPPFENKSSVGTERHVHGLIERVRFSLRGDLGVSGRSGDRLRGCLPIPVAGANQFFAAVGKHDAQAETHGNPVSLAVEVKPQRVGAARRKLKGKIDKATVEMGDPIPLARLDAPLDRGNGLDARLGNSPVGHGIDHRNVRQHK